ncbi:60S ribosomal protein L39 [Branchiostoma belcheri]|nr:60S ribosomal protein L39 [Branchiostoma belcheri]
MFDNPTRKVSQQQANIGDKGAHKTFRIKKKLAKKQKQNRPIPQWVRMKTGNTIRDDLLPRDFCHGEKVSALQQDCFHSASRKDLGLSQPFIEAINMFVQVQCQETSLEAYQAGPVSYCHLETTSFLKLAATEGLPESRSAQFPVYENFRLTLHRRLVLPVSELDL